VVVRGVVRGVRSDESRAGCSLLAIVGLRGVAGSLEPALLAERSKDCAAKGSIE